MKVILAGSREGVEPSDLQHAIAQSKFEITEVVSGAARGVDRYGEQWAENHNIPVARFYPDWNTQGKGAGFIRNHEMALYADALIAVWDGQSRGTNHMILDMKKTGKPVFVYVVGEHNKN